MERDLRSRTTKFALRIIRLVKALPPGRIGDVVGRQIMKSGTSIGANYREAQRAATTKHFASTLQICLREADETAYWLELIAGADMLPAAQLKDLIDECNQLIAMITASIKTARKVDEGDE